jgi:hypothetical protein
MAHRNVLLVEGSSDYHVVRNLWIKHYGEPLPFEIDARKGLTNLREAFIAYLVGSEVDRLGVIVDADEKVSKRWPGFYQALAKHGYKPIPKVPEIDGTLLHRPERSVPWVGVWLMPDNVSPGKLEDFIRFLVPAGDKLWLHAESVLDALPDDLVRFRRVDRSKAHVHTWLAWQREPGIRMGQAVTRFLDPRAPHAIRLVEWLRRVFPDVPAELASDAAPTTP